MTAQGRSQRQQRNDRFRPAKAVANEREKSDVSNLKFVFHGMKIELAMPINPVRAYRDEPADRELLDDAVIYHYWVNNREIDSMNQENPTSDCLNAWVPKSLPKIRKSGIKLQIAFQGFRLPEHEERKCFSRQRKGKTTPVTSGASTGFSFYATRNFDANK